MRKNIGVGLFVTFLVLTAPFTVAIYTHFHDYILPMHWVHRNIESCIVGGNEWRSVTEILQSGKGSCKDLTLVLLDRMGDKDHAEMIITKTPGGSATHAAVLVRGSLVLDPTICIAVKKHVYMETREFVRTVPYSRINTFVRKKVLR